MAEKKAKKTDATQNIREVEAERQTSAPPPKPRTKAEAIRALAAERGFVTDADVAGLLD